MSFAKPQSRPPPIVRGPRPPANPRAASQKMRESFTRVAAATAPLVPPRKAVAEESKERIIDHYEVVESMHASNSGSELHLAKHRRTGELVVMKAIERAKGNSSVSCTAAACYHSKLEHEHLCAQFEIFDSERLVIVMEHVQGITLEQYMLEFGCGSVEAQQILWQLLKAVEHMHDTGVCHRSLRLQNVMLCEGDRCNVKVIDFGTCGPAHKPLTKKVVMPPVYAAPEVLTFAGAPDIEYHGDRIDMWAVGIIGHALLTGRYPFMSAEAAKLGCPEQLPDGVPPAAVALLRGLLHADPSRRMSATEALREPWLTEIQAAEQSPRAVVASGSPAAWLRARASGQLPPAAMSIHEQVLKELMAMGLNEDRVEAALRSGIKDDMTTSYFLVCHRRMKQNHASTAETSAETTLTCKQADDDVSAVETPQPMDKSEDVSSIAQAPTSTAETSTEEPRAELATSGKVDGDGAAADDCGEEGRAATDSDMAHVENGPEGNVGVPAVEADIKKDGLGGL